jgi:SAM-dependent methyltransferase
MDVERFVTPRDVVRSRTLLALPELHLALRSLDARRRERMLDVGCGYGGLTMAVASSMAISDVHGVDIDDDVLAEAGGKGVAARRCEIGRDPLPYPDEHFDVVTCFGMLDYLPWFDGAMHEMRRVLRTGGEVVVSLPNLGSWHNRLALLFGYQPRDVEVSHTALVGVHPYYLRTSDDRRPSGHIHTVTARAFRELAERLGFETVSICGATPGAPHGALAVRAIDRAFGRRPSLARRFIYLGRKP